MKTHMSGGVLYRMWRWFVRQAKESRPRRSIEGNRAIEPAAFPDLELFPLG